MAEGVFDISFDDSGSTACSQYQLENISNRRVCQSSAFRADITINWGPPGVGEVVYATVATIMLGN
jgi:hypothetical protein